ncbi:glycine betaine/L-proline ABC transporter substrate-binding protein ProX [Paracoccus sp. M683]|uniref:glycine betaine/L-proline ABC transporter substrate-binding protein ProX n=1 Tax=Paracoccus sp. M683 TaxID=2594268 RepID=UPI00117DFF10|nr:glycine betaine/L-proline ABC transporter substrate-binding protein ProX [Paracoccus sp. M683]TRW95351.1 glycine betaine/L-proline ABC transporter substrate-binding protein ProX [Paracoccus sp. M683]
MKLISLTAAMALALAAPAFAQDKPGEGVTVRPMLPTQIEEHFQHRILFRALQDLGYTVAEPNEAEYQTIHLALGTGDADFTAVSWRTLHDAFYQEAGGDAVLTKVGTYIQGALQGYLVDKATYDSGVTDLSQLKDPEIAAKFDADGDGKADLAGCIPGWGCERVIETALDAYELRDTVTHNQGAYQAMIADVMARFQNGQPILYYTWTPYWVSGALVPGRDVEWLSVPFTALPEGYTGNTEFNGKNLGFAVDSIGVVARNDFLEANPAAAKLFEVATLDINDISAENKLIADGEDSSADIDKHVDDWIEAHRETYDSWLQQARDAAK